jgi:hypothetical protein
MFAIKKRTALTNLQVPHRPPPGSKGLGCPCCLSLCREAGEQLTCRLVQYRSRFLSSRASRRSGGPPPWLSATRSTSWVWRTGSPSGWPDTGDTQRTQRGSSRSMTARASLDRLQLAPFNDSGRRPAQTHHRKHRAQHQQGASGGQHGAGVEQRGYKSKADGGDGEGRGERGQRKMLAAPPRELSGSKSRHTSRSVRPARACSSPRSATPKCCTASLQFIR